MKISRRHFLQFGIASVSTFVGYSSFGDPRKLEISYHDLPSNRITQPVRVLQLSDLHLGSETTDYNFIAKTVQALRPDLIVVTGDIFDDRDDVKGFYNFFTQITTLAPIVNVLGNWDYGADMLVSEVLSHFKKLGLVTLINETIRMLIKGQTLQITGLDDLRMGNPQLKKAIENFQPDNDFNLLLFHCPGEFHRVCFLKNTYPDEIPDFNLCLSGHTHGGQINLWGFRPILPKGSGGYVHGWYHESSLRMYVNRGIGCTRIPMRFMARPEISVFDLKPV